MRRILTALFILIAPSVWATRTAISSLPYTISSGTAADTFYLAGSLSSSSGTALTISASNVKLDLNGNTLNFGTSSVSACTGIRISGSNVKVFGPGRVIHNIADDHDSLLNIRGFDISGGHDTVYGLTVEVRGYCNYSGVDGQNGIHAIYATGTGYYANYIGNDSILNHCSGYYRRDVYPACGVRMQYSANDALISNPDLEYHTFVDSCYIETPNAGVFIYGGEISYTGVGWVKNCTIKMGTKADPNGTWCGNCSGGYRYGEAYGVMSRGAEIMKISHNLIYPDTSGYDSDGDSVYGGNGIFIERTTPTTFANYFSEIDSNTAYASVGPQGGTQTCLRIRHVVKHLKVYGNTFVNTVDTNTNTWWRIAGGCCIWWGYGNSAAGDQDSVLVYNNTLYGREGPGITVADYTGVKCIRFTGKPDASYWEGWGNHLYSQATFYDFYPDSYVRYVLEHNDTLTAITPRRENWVWNNYGGDWSAEGNVFRDLVYESGVDYTQIRLRGDVQDIRLQQTIPVNITINGSPYEGVVVTATDAYGHLQWTDTSDAGGGVGKPTTFRYEIYSGTDSTAYNNFTLSATNGDTTLTATVTVSPTMATTDFDFPIGHGAPRAITYNGNPRNFTTIPRYRVHALGDTLLVSVAQYGSVSSIPGSWLWSYDKGQTINQTTQSLKDPSWLNQTYLDDHAASWADNGKFFIVFRTASSAPFNQPAYGRIISSPYTAANMGSLITFQTDGSDSTYYPLVAVNGDTTWFINLSARTDRTITYFMSTNDFATMPTRQTIPTLSAGNVRDHTRAGVVMPPSGLPEVVYMWAGPTVPADTSQHNRIIRAKWNGTSFDTLTVCRVNDLLDRGYTHTVMNGKTHVVFWRASDHRFIHAWESSTNTFTVDTFGVANMPTDLLGGVSLTVYDTASNARLYFFSTFLNGADTSVLAKTWTEASGWDTDSMLLVREANAVYLATPPYVPNTWDSIPLFWQNNGANQVYIEMVKAVSAGGGESAPAGDPLSQSGSVSNIAQTTARIGTIFNNVSGSMDYIWYLWGTTNPPTVRQDSTATPSNPDVYNISGLTASTTYYIRTIARDALYTDTSAVIPFTTLATPAPQIISKEIKGNVKIEGNVKP